MDAITQANQLRGFVESLKLSDNISKAQIEMVLSKLDLLIRTLDDDLWERIGDEVRDSLPQPSPGNPQGRYPEEEADDLPF